MAQARMPGARQWTIYDDPVLLGSVSATRRDGRRELLLGLDGMHCAACVGRVEKLLADVATDVRVNLVARFVEFAWDPARVPLSAILRKLEAAGFVPRVLADDAELRAQAGQRRAALARIGVSAILSMQVMMLAWPAYFPDMPVDPGLQALLRWMQWLLATPVVLYGGWPFFLGAAQALRGGALNMDVPVALAIAIAYLASAARTWAGAGEIYFDTASMFVLFLAAGRYVEGRTRAQAAQRLRLLAGRQALTARRLGVLGVDEVPIGLLKTGDAIQVLPGEAAPVDGELLNGPCELDESLLTGEALPIERGSGETMLAGSINVGRHLVVLRATRVGPETTMSQIARLLNRAQSERPAYQQAADRLAGHFILAVLALAVAGAALALDRGTDEALSIALAVLVASCPCALSLAVPATVAAASSCLARAGALVARPAALLRLASVDTIVFDKTGTLTGGAFSLRRVLLLGRRSRDEALAIAASLERDSKHPIAAAFAHVAGAARAVDVRQQADRGLSGYVHDVRYWLGAPDRAPVPIAAAESLQAGPGGAGLTWIALTDEREAIALFGVGVGDRPEAADVVQALRDQGQTVELLTGDSAGAAAPLARRLGILNVSARQAPGDKLARVRRLQAAGHVVLAVGDGFNDAPILAGADVAVAMPGGAALAQSRADIVLAGDSLAPLPLLLDAATRARRVMRQNLGWALAYNVSVLPLAMAGWLSPWMAALGMSLSSLLVVANALRAGRPCAARGAATASMPAAPQAC